jgi:multidrug efflux pump subunit AcrA (membrane-fusion protein)
MNQLQRLLQIVAGVCLIVVLAGCGALFAPPPTPAPTATPTPTGGKIEGTVNLNGNVRIPLAKVKVELLTDPFSTDGLKTIATCEPTVHS